jgi:hypothetical protein
MTAVRYALSTNDFIKKSVRLRQRLPISIQPAPIIPMRSALRFFPITLFAALSLQGCDRASREGDLKFIGFRYLSDGSAYMSIDSKKYMGDGYAESLNAAPHLKIHGSWCDLTWIENKPDGSKEPKSVSFPTSNVYSFKWKD